MLLDRGDTAFALDVIEVLAQPGGGYKATRLLTVGKGQPAYLATGHLQGPKGPSDLAASFWGPFNVDGPASLSVFLSGCR